MRLRELCGGYVYLLYVCGRFASARSCQVISLFIVPTVAVSTYCYGRNNKEGNNSDISLEGKYQLIWKLWRMWIQPKWIQLWVEGPDDNGALLKTLRHKYLCRFDTNLRFLTLSLTLVCVKSTQTGHKNTNWSIPENIKTQIFVSIWHKFAFFNPKFNPSLCQIDTNPTQKHKFAHRPPHDEQICVGQHKDTNFFLKILQIGLSVPAWSGDQRYPYSNHITAFVEKVITFFYIRENSY